jgi:hypothetical protein
MNIVKLQNELRSVPDQALVGYVQNPTGQVPTYLALTELQRRKEMREQYQKEAPQKSVAESLIEENMPQPAMQQGIASVAPQQAPQPQAPMPQAPQGMAGGGMVSFGDGGVASLDTGDMYNEENFATGGIVAFAKGGTPPDLDKPDDLGVVMPYVPTWDDIKMEQENAYQQYGVDPEFYAKQARKLQEERDELKGDKTQAGWMALARAGLGMAAGTSPFALKNISEGAIQGVTQYGADIKDIKAQDRLLKQADMKLAEAQQAQARGDAQGAIKIMDDRKNLLLNAQLKEADIRKDMRVADAKAKAAAAGKVGDLNSKIYDKAQKDFASSFPNGAQETVFQNNPGFFQYVKNVYLKNAQDYIMSGTMPSIPTEKQLLDMYTKSTGAKAKPAASNPVSSINITRPAAVDEIFKKHEAKPGNKRYITTNTPEELNTPYDLAGPHEPEDEYSQ